MSNSTSLDIRIKATREGGNTQRFHALPHIAPYSVAAHSFGAVSLILLLHPNPSLNLIKAMQWHDVAERWLGDMPSPAKSGHVGLKTVYEAVEEEHLTRLDLTPPLTGEERQWLVAIDRIECWLWCREELALGNSNAKSYVEGIAATMHAMNLGGDLPEPVWRFFMRWSEAPHSRLSDKFDWVRRALAIDGVRP